MMDKNILLIVLMLMLAGAAMFYNNYMITNNIDRNFELSRQIAFNQSENVKNSAADRDLKANQTEMHFLKIVNEIKNVTDTIDHIGNASLQKLGVNAAIENTQDLNVLKQLLNQTNAKLDKHIQQEGSLIVNSSR